MTHTRQRTGQSGSAQHRRPRLAWLLAALALATCLPCRAGQTVRVGVYDNTPKVGMSESGRPEGIFIDLIEAIAEANDWTLEYVHGTWAEGLDRLSTGEIDLMPDVALTSERENLYRFHQEPVLSDWFQVYARPRSGIRSVLDLHDKRVSVLARSIHQDAFERAFLGLDLNVTLEPYPDIASAFAAVERGEVDAVVTNRFYGAAHAKDGALEDTAVIFNPTRLFFAAPLTGDPSLLTAVDVELKRLKDDPSSVYYQSLRRWTSDDTRFRMPTWLRMLVILGPTGLLLTVLWSVSLRRQVAVRTEELRERNAENVRLYEEVHAHATELERRVAERTSELTVANEGLLAAKESAEAADRIKSAFLATMSHELRTPLNSIIGFTGILLQELAGPLSEEQARQLGMIQSSGRHLLALINDVLDISKIEAGQVEVRCEPFEVTSAIGNATETIMPLAGRKSLPVEIVVSSEVGTMVSDQRRVEQILLNLLSNAVKFTERGNVTLECYPDGEMVVFRVADTGPGIGAEDLQRLFRPFQQLDTGLARQHEGTGLGLAICKRLSERLGGTIEVESELGRGTTFTVTLPVKSGEPA